MDDKMKCRFSKRKKKAGQKFKYWPLSYSEGGKKNSKVLLVLYS